MHLKDLANLEKITNARKKINLVSYLCVTKFLNLVVANLVMIWVTI